MEQRLLPEHGKAPQQALALAFDARCLDSIIRSRHPFWAQLFALYSVIVGNWHYLAVLALWLGHSCRFNHDLGEFHRGVQRSSSWCTALHGGLFSDLDRQVIVAAQ
jgi:hypothetical protein